MISHVAQEMLEHANARNAFEIFTLNFSVKKGLGVLKSYRAETTKDGLIIDCKPCYETYQARAQEIVHRAAEAAMGCVLTGWGCWCDPEVVKKNVEGILGEPPEEIGIDPFDSSGVDSVQIRFFYRRASYYDYDEVTWRELAAIFADDNIAHLWSRRSARRAK